MEDQIFKKSFSSIENVSGTSNLTFDPSSITIWQNPIPDFKRDFNPHFKPVTQLGWINASVFYYNPSKGIDMPSQEQIHRVEENIARRYEDKIIELHSEITDLRNTIANHLLTAEITRPGSEDMIPDSELSEGEIMEYVLRNIEIGQVFYPSDIANALGVDLVSVMEALSKLKESGKLTDVKR